MTNFISGIPALKTIGAGRLVRALADQGAKIVWVGNKSEVADQVRNRKPFAALRSAVIHYARRWKRQRLLADPNFMDGEESVVLLHPAEIGMDWCIQFIRQRKAPTWIFMFDSSFFCIRSYNHLKGAVCLGCIEGNWSAAQTAGCKAYPIQDSRALEHQQAMLEFARAGKVKFLAQSETNARMARRHFGESAVVRVAGMWTDDVGEAVSAPYSARSDMNEGYDVVLHGSSASAKGALWAIELARKLPDVRFLFPFSDDSTHAKPPTNIDFKTMSWDTGLRSEVEKAKITLVPSLWSASIEAALVKSILIARRTVVVAEKTAYSSEISDEVVYKLPVDASRAAEELRSILKNFKPLSFDCRETWRKSFAKSNGQLLQNITRETDEGVE
jgi:hypothetical protein